jgi:Transposase DDE domain group 1
MINPTTIKKRHRENLLRSVAFKMIMPSLPAAASSSDRCRRSHQVCRATTSTATMRANQLRLWFASMAYVLLCALRRIALHHTPFAKATCGTIRLKLLKIGALVRVSVRRIKVAMASACPAAHTWGCAAKRLAAAANARASPA